jgi:hypothetical protein
LEKNQVSLDQILLIIKQEFPQQSIDLSESLELLKVSINDTMNAIEKKMSAAFARREFGAQREYMILAESVHQYEQRVDNLIELLELEDTAPFIKEAIGLSDEPIDSERRKNYAAYTVDHQVEHTLYENFTHIRPYAFRLGQQEQLFVKTWIEMLIETCNILIDKDAAKFLSFEHIKEMNGKKSKYISSKKDGMRKPHPLRENLFLETNMSANGVRNLILKMLKAYNIKATDYKIYYRADYTELNQE